MGSLVAKKTKNLFYLFAVLFVSSLSVGCASFSGNQLTNIENILEANAAKEDVYIQYESRFNEEISPYGFAKAQKETIKKIIIESRLFNDIYHQDTNDLSKPKYILNYKLNNYGNVPLTVISAFISGFSCLVIPGFGVDNYTLTTELLTPEGDLLWEKTYNDKMTTVTWLPLFPLMFNENHQTITLNQKILNNMYRHSLKDISEEKILSRSTKLKQQ